MPTRADHLVVRHEVSPPTTRGAATAPSPPPRGLLTIQEAILRDAAADVAGTELQMGRAQSPARLLEHGPAAVAALDRTIRLLQSRRSVLLEQLAEVPLSAHQAHVPTTERPSARLRASRLAGRA